MKKIRVFVLGLLALALIAACATSNDLKWAQGREALSDVEIILTQARAPCVDFGPEHPGCLLDDETTVKIDKMIRAARYTLARLDGVAAGTELLSAETLVTELNRILEQLLLEAAAVQ